MLEIVNSFQFLGFYSHGKFIAPINSCICYYKIHDNTAQVKLPLFNIEVVNTNLYDAIADISAEVFLLWNECIIERTMMQLTNDQQELRKKLIEIFGIPENSQ